MIGTISIIVALVTLLGSFAAAEQGSGYMPFSGYAAERRWSIVSAILLIISIVAFGVWVYVGQNP